VTEPGAMAIDLGGPRYALSLEYVDGVRIDEPGPVRVGIDHTDGVLHIIRFDPDTDDPLDGTFVPMPQVRSWTLADYQPTA
jgi:hypothetical protein